MIPDWMGNARQALISQNKAARDLGGIRKLSQCTIKEKNKAKIVLIIVLII